MALRPGARAWAVWSVGLAAYIMAVLHRTSLGVAGLDAQGRFDIGAGALASFVVLQLLVYAGLQVPVGILLDRFGSLRLVVAGGLLMAGGQALMAAATGVEGAVLARVLVGAGDAMTFISVLRLVPQWYADAGSISIYYASRRQVPAKTRVFVDFVAEAFRRQRLAERFAGSIG